MKTKKIKDNIHGYIYFSILEKSYLSHPLVLRMHQVRQNGAAFLTYPSIRVHRYEHSIGAMHLAGELFLRSFRFSNDCTIGDTLTAVCKSICGDTFDEVLGAQPEILREDPLYQLHCLSVKNAHDLAVVLMFQAVRVAMLVHDIGHPPFSHTTEVALKQLDLSYPDHERVGLSLLTLINADVRKSAGQVPQYVFIQAVTKLVRAIVDKNEIGHNLLEGIASIVSSDLDADRLDYVKRDALAGGLSTNSYDIGRLYDALKLKTQYSGNLNADASIGMVYTSDAMSTLEAFFGMRFHMYRWMLFHHSVILHNMTMISIVHDMYELSNSGTGEIESKVSDFFSIATKKDRFNEYWYFTDSYMMEIMTSLLRHMDGNVSLKSKFPRLYRSLKTFLHRSKEFLTPFWKAPADYAEFSKAVIAQAGQLDGPSKGGLKHSVDVKDLNARLRTRFERLSEELRDNNLEKSSHLNNNDYFSHRFSKQIEGHINPRLVDEGFEVRAYYLAKFRAIPKNMHLVSRDNSYPLEALSPTIASLDEAWNALPHLWLFLEQTSVDNGERASIQVSELSKKRQEVMPKVAKALSELIGAAG